MEIKSLEDLGKDQLFSAFREAFADYELQLDQEELFRMLKRRGFQPDLSFGAFDEDKLVSFTFNGIGILNGLKTAYDTGTGTIPEYRGKGLAGAVFRHTEEKLKAASVEQYLLEVLQHNTGAVKLYKKLGFETIRSFNYFHQDTQQLKFNPENLDAAKVKDVSLDEVASIESGGFPPSWQNSVNAVRRSPEDFRVLAYSVHQILLGKLIFEPQSGDITQIFVLPEHRRNGIGTALLSKALEINRHDRIKLINADSRDIGMIRFMESLGIPLQGKQYEMIKKL